MDEAKADLTVFSVVGKKHSCYFCGKLTNIMRESYLEKGKAFWACPKHTIEGSTSVISEDIPFGPEIEILTYRRTTNVKEDFTMPSTCAAIWASATISVRDPPAGS